MYTFDYFTANSGELKQSLRFKWQQVYVSAPKVRANRLVLLRILVSVQLTREDTATDGDISGEGAFLVNVSAVNSLVKTKDIVSVTINII